MHATIELHFLILSVPSYSKHYKPLSRVIYIELFMCRTLDTWVLPHISCSRNLLSSCKLSAQARSWDWKSVHDAGGGTISGSCEERGCEAAKVMKIAQSLTLRLLGLTWLALSPAQASFRKQCIGSILIK